MKPIVKKVLESGLVDKSMVELLEKWRSVPDGSSTLVPEVVKVTTRDQMSKLAEDIAVELERERALKETQLDLDQIRWSTSVTIRDDKYQHIAWQVPAVIDRMGRLYFRFQDVRESWFVPGYLLTRKSVNSDTGYESEIKEVILEKSVLYVGEYPTCVQVTSAKSA